MRLLVLKTVHMACYLFAWVLFICNVIPFVQLTSVFVSFLCSCLYQRVSHCYHVMLFTAHIFYC